MTNGAAVIASAPSTATPSQVRETAGTTTAETAGGRVWAKKTSIRSMSRVARWVSSAPALPRVAAGACGTRRSKNRSRSRRSAVNATQCPA